MSSNDYSEAPEGTDLPKRRRRRGPRWRRVLGWIAVITTAVIIGAVLVAYSQYLGTLHSIRTFKTSSVGTDRPPVYNSSENILVVGSDSRSGANQKFGKYVQGQRSDTMMIVHIRPAHRGAVVISLPRDTEAPILGCKPDGLGDPGQTARPSGVTEMLNAAFAYGGPPCLWHTVEQMTGIRIDHYIGLTFSGFEKVINDIGGVNVCLPKAIKDPKSGLNLSAGRHHVGGGQALAFWRERYVGEGSDTQRIQRQQYLMAGLMQELKSGHLLTDYTRMYSVLRDAAHALTTDDGLSLGDMVSLAEDLHHLTEKSVQFVTVPNVPDPADPNRVLWVTSEADKLFYAIAHDTTLPKTHQPVTVTVKPQQVQVEVLNGNGVQGAAAQAAAALKSRGFDVVGSTNANSDTYTSSVIEYATSNDLPEVDTLKAQVPSVQVQQVPSLPPGTLDLILGSSFTGLASPSSTSTGSSSSQSSQDLNKAYGGINASARICSDSSAFDGPDNPAEGT